MVLFTSLKRFLRNIVEIKRHIGYKNISKTARLGHNLKIYSKDNLIMEEYTNLNAGAVVMNTRAKFIMKKWSGSAIGLTVITGNHISVVGMNFKQSGDDVKEKLDKYKNYDKDVVVEEDVWLAANVTLLSGVRIGRGSIVGAGSVVRMSTPPYSILTGNPAKIVGFRFTPEEIIEHEKIQYSDEERLPLDLLQKNYSKYFLKKTKEISSLLKL